MLSQILTILGVALVVIGAVLIGYGLMKLVEYVDGRNATKRKHFGKHNCKERGCRL